MIASHSAAIQKIDVGMARSVFEQLQDVVTEPRQAFEDIVSFILKCLSPSSRRVRVYRGDGGIDSFTGTLGESGEADVFQMKYFPGPWQDSQRQQIRDAYKTAKECEDYRLNTWTLCVPTRLRKEDIRWFDDWRKRQAGVIQLLDGDDLTLSLEDERCGLAREKLREWGMVGVSRRGADFAVRGFIRRQDARTGLTADIVLQLRNTGDRSARNIVATVSHAETGCVAGGSHYEWEGAGSGSLNPRTLRYANILNPTDAVPIMAIHLCERSTMPFQIQVRLTAEDKPASLLRCEITPEQIAAGQPVDFVAE